MIKRYLRTALTFCSLLLVTLVTSVAEAKVKGIYLTQTSLENTTYLNHLIKHAKASGIDTFVVDLEKISKRYRDNIPLLKENNIKYVARIVIFPDGARPYMVNDSSYWQRRY